MYIYIIYYIYGLPYCQVVCAWPINGPGAVDWARSTALLRTGLHVRHWMGWNVADDPPGKLEYHSSKSRISNRKSRVIYIHIKCAYILIFLNKCAYVPRWRNDIAKQVWLRDFSTGWQMVSLRHLATRWTPHNNNRAARPTMTRKALDDNLENLLQRCNIGHPLDISVCSQQKVGKGCCFANCNRIHYVQLVSKTDC